MSGESRWIPANFWSSVDVREPAECWPWKGPHFRETGYGIAYWRGHTISTSRLAWILTAQITPPRHLAVCHTCHNPPCCNPNHLYVGTASDNMRDSVRAGRHYLAKRTHCERGHLYDANNTRFRKRIPNGDPYRECRECRNQRERNRKRRVRIARGAPQ